MKTVNRYAYLRHYIIPQLCIRVVFFFALNFMVRVRVCPVCCFVRFSCLRRPSDTGNPHQFDEVFHKVGCNIEEMHHSSSNNATPMCSSRSIGNTFLDKSFESIASQNSIFMADI